MPLESSESEMNTLALREREQRKRRLTTFEGMIDLPTPMTRRILGWNLGLRGISRRRVGEVCLVCG